MKICIFQDDSLPLLSKGGTGQMERETGFRDGRVVSLIHKYLRSGVISHGLFESSDEGTPQGGPLSPLLSNAMLNELDKELIRRRHPFVRYSDDALRYPPRDTR